ncbi:MAG: hypothetical protein K6G58_05090 [Lachnospiraceae bacterium]|nr:hypothetical protein [Lachnospiraceae bacterium]
MKMQMRFFAGKVIDDVLYFSATMFNGLFGMKMDTGRIDFLGSFKNVPLDRVLLHRKCLTYNRWLIFIPQNAGWIHLVHADSLEQTAIKVADDGKYFYFADAVIWGDSLYLLPGKKEQQALIVDLKDLRVEPINSLNEFIKKEVPDSPEIVSILFRKFIFAARLQAVIRPA